MRPPRPSFRSSLIRIHDAIITIEEELGKVSQIPALTRLEKLVVLLEDRRFLRHRGIDWRAVLRELLKAVTGKWHGGASTIDMQLFRTISDRYERTLRRKIREWIGTYVIQRRFTKLEILRIYLQVAYFGTGIKGVLEAARALFPELVNEDDSQIDEERFTLEQLAEIASLLVYPKPRIANANWQAKVRRRANYGLALYSGRKKELDKILR